jgi:hypothetical protein
VNKLMVEQYLARLMPNIKTNTGTDLGSRKACVAILLLVIKSGKKDDVTIQHQKCSYQVIPRRRQPSKFLHLRTRRMHLCHKGHANVLNPTFEIVDAFLRIDTLGLRL